MNYDFTMSSLEVYLYAIGANLTFSTAGLIYSFYARKFSPIWIGQVKVTVATIAFILAFFLAENFVPLSSTAFILLFLSGLGGLCVGDILLFRAFATLGAARSLVLFSFQPLLLGVYGFFFLDQIFTVNQTIAVLCMIVCVYVFMMERKGLTGSWDTRSFLWAFGAICLDAFGVMLTRTAYEMTPGLETYEVNIVRCFGALAGFFLIKPSSFKLIVGDLRKLKLKENFIIIGSGVGGCFIALALYLAALKHAHVGTLTAISITGPVWVSLLECLYHRRLPNRFLSVAFIFFLAGFYLMVKA